MTSADYSIFENEETKAPPVWTVSEVNQLVKDVIEQSLQPVWVRGEIGNITIHRSGHVYFSLKDERSQLSAVFFRGADQARRLNLASGMDIEVWGRLGVYHPRGIYQILVNRIRTRGVGALQQRFEELKRKLREEGLFDQDRKRAVPAFPRCVGVVTSPEGAALRDFLQILHRRFAEMHIRICPASVQGGHASQEIAAGIEYLNRTNACDVIVVTRGGGSLEDLWPFNEEIVARAVARSEIPVISAVGHEVDFTICDYAADLRVATPSAAAELVIARKAEMTEALANYQRRLKSQLRLQLSECKRRLERAAGSRVFHEPRSVVYMHQQHVDELSTRLSRALKERLTSARARLEQSRGRLTALSPKNVLERGYAILLSDSTGRAVRSPGDTEVGDTLQGILHKGSLEVTVNRISQEQQHD